MLTAAVGPHSAPGSPRGAFALLAILGVVLLLAIGVGSYFASAPAPTPTFADLVPVTGVLQEVRVQTLRGPSERVLVRLRDQPWTFQYERGWPQYAAVRAWAGRTGTATIWAPPRDLANRALVPIWQLVVDGQAVITYDQTAPYFASVADAQHVSTPFAILFMLGLFLIPPVLVVGLAHRFRGDAARWQVVLDGSARQVAVRWSALHGPAVLVDGQPVAATQDPPWNRHPNVRQREYRFGLGARQARILEEHPTAGSRFAAYSLEFDGQPIPPAPSPWLRLDWHRVGYPYWAMLTTLTMLVAWAVPALVLHVLGGAPWPSTLRSVSIGLGLAVASALLHVVIWRHGGLRKGGWKW